MQTEREQPPPILSLLQYFVANLCELKVAEHQRKRIGLRYARTPGQFLKRDFMPISTQNTTTKRIFAEVERLQRRLRKAKATAEELAAADPKCYNRCTSPDSRRVSRRHNRRQK